MVSMYGREGVGRMKLYTSEIESYLGNITQGPSIYASDENTAKKAISNTKLFAVNEVKSITICEQQGESVWHTQRT